MKKKREPTEPEGQYERFTDLLRRVVSVSKREVLERARATSRGPKAKKAE
jgi:hypothetical protein